MQIRELRDGRMVLGGGPSLLRFAVGSLFAVAIASGCYWEALPYAAPRTAMGIAVALALLTAFVSAFGRSITLDKRAGTIQSAMVLIGGVSFPGKKYAMSQLRKVDFETESEYERWRKRTSYRSFFVFQDRSKLDIDAGPDCEATRRRLADDAQRIARYCGVRFGG